MPTSASRRVWEGKARRPSPLQLRARPRASPSAQATATTISATSTCASARPAANGAISPRRSAQADPAAREGRQGDRGGGHHREHGRRRAVQGRASLGQRSRAARLALPRHQQLERAARDRRARHADGVRQHHHRSQPRPSACRGELRRSLYRPRRWLSPSHAPQRSGARAAGTPRERQPAGLGAAQEPARGQGLDLYRQEPARPDLGRLLRLDRSQHRLC
jgi:hypothetical protein